MVSLVWCSLVDLKERLARDAGDSPTGTAAEGSRQLAQSWDRLLVAMARELALLKSAPTPAIPSVDMRDVVRNGGVLAPEVCASPALTTTTAITTAIPCPSCNQYHHRRRRTLHYVVPRLLSAVHNHPPKDAYVVAPLACGEKKMKRHAMR
jgi:hypothetical protein